MALFSATMPAQIKRISKRHMNEPVEIRIEAKTITADNIEQVYMVVPEAAKFEALVRVLETESYDGILIFARTRLATTELAEKLSARGYDVAALNGDMEQRARERTIARLKSGKVDIVVATDVAARGLDVERISLVVNFDIPGDSEAYIHRIGRTGRVGRYGKAILFANPRERRLLQAIERVTRQPLKPMEMPSHDAVTRKRVEKFRGQLVAAMEAEPQEFFQDLGLELMEELNVDILQLAAAALCLAQQDRPLQVKESRALASPRWDEPKPPGRERPPARGRPGRNQALYRLEVGFGRRGRGAQHPGRGGQRDRPAQPLHRTDPHPSPLLDHRAAGRSAPSHARAPEAGVRGAAGPEDLAGQVRGPGAGRAPGRAAGPGQGPEEPQDDAGRRPQEARQGQGQTQEQAVTRRSAPHDHAGRWPPAQESRIFVQLCPLCAHARLLDSIRSPSRRLS